MKNQSEKLKEFITFLAMAFLMLLPITTEAQSGTDGFFTSSANETYNDRNLPNSFLNASNQTFGDNSEAPAGDGLLVMLAAGAVYTLTRRHRRYGTCIVALILMAGLTQCRKNTTVIDTVGKKMIDITINVGNGSRIDVNTMTGAVSFEKNDCLFIVSNGEYKGYVKHDGTNFTGSIEEPTEDKPMYIYYLGNKRYQDLAVGSRRCSVNISDQTGKLPVISCGMTDVYSSSTTTYDVYLKNKCALVKFNVTTSSDQPTCLFGFNNEMIIDFENNIFMPDTIGEMVIKLKAGNGERWAILLPNSESMAEGADGTAFSKDYQYIGKRPAVNALNNNDFVTTAYDVTVNTTSTGNTSFDNKKFSVSATKQVEFAPGNVQHVQEGRGWVWKFADHQYDVLHNENEQRYEGAYDRDRFGWGTGNNPDLASCCNKDYPYSLDGTDPFVDWGANFTTDPDHGAWHTPKCIEWKYLLFVRPATTLNGVNNARYARARVNGVNGLILFPDIYHHPDGVALPLSRSINYTNNNHNGNYTDNDYNVADWTEMEEAGVVFLPTTGQRIYKNSALGFYDVDESGHYWSQCDLGDEEHACNLFYSSYRPYVFDKNDKYKGYAVRLVRE